MLRKKLREILRASEPATSSVESTRIARSTIRSCPAGRNFGPAMVEAMEERILRTDTIGQSTVNHTDYITEFSNYALFADVRVGDNGDTEGLSTTAFGSSPYEATLGYAAWDSNPFDGFDSGWREISLTADVSGSDYMNFGVDQASETGYSTDNYGAVSSISIRAAVLDAGMAMSWDDVVVSFYRDGDLITTVQVGSGPSASTLGTSTSQSKESILTLTPQVSNYDKIVISACVRLQASVGVYPGADSIFGDVIINGA